MEKMALFLREAKWLYFEKGRNGCSFAALAYLWSNWTSAEFNMVPSSAPKINPRKTHNISAKIDSREEKLNDNFRTFSHPVVTHTIRLSSAACAIHFPGRPWPPPTSQASRPPPPSPAAAARHQGQEW
jgi:hypothetical protein